MHEVTGETIPEMRTMLKAMLNNGKAIVRLTPLRPMHGEKAYQRA